MKWAEINGERRSPIVNFKGAICPLCKKEVIAKCGLIKEWHWSHRADKECDSFGEGETLWHLSWKNLFPKEMQEVIISKCISDYCNDEKYHAPCNHINCNDCEFIKHRADIKKINGLVIELQNSPISIEDIEDRESFYENMIWLFNGETFGKGLNIREKRQEITCSLDDMDGHYHGNTNGFKKYIGKIYHTFRWKHPPKSLWFVNKPCYIDLNNGFIFKIRKIHKNIPCGGWGDLMTKFDFIKKYGENNDRL